MSTIGRVMFAVVLIAAAVPAIATIRTVSQFGTAQYQTISAAITAAVSGDTILIAPGYYDENLTINNERLRLIGAGWDLVTVYGDFVVQNGGSAGTVVEGLRLQYTNNFDPVYSQISCDSITLRRCLIRQTGNLQIMNHSGVGRLYVEDCVLLHNATGGAHLIASASANSTAVFRGCIFANILASPSSIMVVATGNNGSPVEIHNCTMVNFNRAFTLTGSQPLIAINNVFYDWTGAPSWGTFLAGSVFDYTAADATAPAFPAGFTNNISLGANNPFVNYSAATNYVLGTSDLHLNTDPGGLMLTDAGHPSVFDLDSTRSDVGAYGGPKPQVDNGVPAYPFPISLTMPNLIESGDSLNVNSTGRIGPRY